MSQPQRDISDLLSENLDYALKTAASELTRGETKASILLAINSVTEVELVMSERVMWV